MKIIKLLSFPLFGTGKISSPPGGKLKGGFLQYKKGKGGLSKIKRINLILLIVISAGIVFLTGCESDPPPPDISEKGLKDYYKDYFPMGVSVSPSHLITGTGERGIIDKEFNSITAENVMKMGPIHPQENTYYWTDADKIVNFAVSNNLKVRGHTLLWHQNTPSWIFKNGDGTTVAKDTLLKRLKDHITSVVTRYKGKVYAWDVVNEAIDDNAAKVYRESQWYTICGEEYIAKAFQWAHEADPDALLFYNDYSTVSPSKRDKIYTFLRGLIDAGIPVHGIGMQGHWSISWPSETDVRSAIEKFATLGIKIQITELDVSVYSSSEDFSIRTPGDDLFTADREQKQIDKYKMIFSVFRDYKNFITGVTFWNVSDKKSWLDNFPVANRKNYPLLFDQNYKRKKAYYEVVKF
jgi:endo-1,4-beta-xylanase